MKKPPPIALAIELVDHGGKCTTRGIPLVDVYLSNTAERGNAIGCWMQALDVSVPMAGLIAEWFAAHGVEITREEASTEAEHSRDLFTGMK